MTAPAVLGIDPGKEGAFAVLPLEGGEPLLLGSLPYSKGDAQPLVRALAALLRGVDARLVLAGVELVNSFGMGRQSAFVFGQGVGALLAMCELEGWPTIRPRPQAWQATIGATGKGKAIDPLGPVSRLFPTTNLVPRGCRVPHAGYIDALGIAEHVRRIATRAPAAASPFG